MLRKELLVRRKMVKLFVVVLLFYTLLRGNSCYAYTLSDTQKLWSDLTTGYNKNDRPIQNQTDAINVDINFGLYSIQEINEITGKVSATGTLELIWKDEVLVWDPADYNNIYSLMIPVSEIWYPPLIIGNPYSTSTAIKVEDRSFVRLLLDGTIMFYPSGVYEINSPLDSKYYPFDKQAFSIQFVVAGFMYREVNLNAGMTYLSTIFDGNGEWSVLNMTREVAIFNEYSSIATFTVSLERKSTFMVVNIILPIVFLAAINLLVFVLPPEAGERVSFSVTILLSLAVFMTLVGDNLPKTSDPLPVLSFYLLATLTISTLMCVMAMLNLAIHHKNEQSRPPKCIAVVAATVLRRKTGFKLHKVEDNSSEADSTLETEKRIKPLRIAFENNKEVLLKWKDVSYSLDILCFVGFLIGLCSINIYYIIMLTSH